MAVCSARGCSTLVRQPLDRYCSPECQRASRELVELMLEVAAAIKKAADTPLLFALSGLEPRELRMVLNRLQHPSEARSALRPIAARPAPFEDAV